MSQTISDIKARISIEDLVSQYVILKKMGGTLKGLCPFHAEKTPSFIVSPVKGICWCFGCNKGGDIFNFIMEVENLEFSEALKTLAERAGVSLEQYQASDALPKTEKAALLDVNEEAAKFFEEQLWNSLEGQKVRDYLKNRGLTEQTIKTFRLGYAPDSFDATYHHLLKKKFAKSKIVQVGLALAKDTSGENVYDRFRGRLIFPVQDSLGKVVGFGGRALAKDQEPKYLNTPETKLYQKGNLLYGFQLTKNNIKKCGEVLLVEGYMDMLAAFQNGLDNVVAINGTALTQKQLSLLKPIAPVLVLGFDGDKAGQEASRRGFEMAMEMDFEIKKLVLTGAKDIAEFCQKNAAVLVEAYQKSPGFVEALYQEILTQYGNKLISEKRKILAEFGPYLLKIKSSIERDEYVKKIALDLNLTEVQVYDEIRLHSISKGNSQGLAGRKSDDLLGKIIKLGPEEVLLGLYLDHTQLLLDNKIDVGQAICSENLKAIYKQYQDQYNPTCNKEELFNQILAGLESEEKSLLSLVTLYVAEKYVDFSNEALLIEVTKLVEKIRQTRSIEEKHRLHRKLLEAEKQSDQRLMQETLNEISKMH